MPDFEFPTQLKTLEGAPSEFHPLYEEKEGVFQMIAPLAKKVSDLGNLQKTLDTERKRANALDSSVKKWGDLKPEEVTARLAELQSLKDKIEAGEITPADNAKVEELINARMDRVKKGHDLETQRLKEDLAKEQARVSNLDALMRRTKLEQELSAAALEVGVEKHSVEDAIANALRIFEADENYSPKPKEVSGYGSDFTPKKYFAEIKDSNEKPGWFFNPKNSGYDSTLSGGSRTSTIKLRMPARWRFQRAASRSRTVVFWKLEIRR